VQILVTGASGFVGQHLVQHLNRVQPDAKLHGTFFRSTTVLPASEKIELTQIDLCQSQDVTKLIERLRPDAIYHLAGQSSPARSFRLPWETLETNIRAQFNVLQACVDTGIAPRIVTISSAEVYGSVQPEELPLRESSPLRPASPYSLSKITQDMMGWQYHLSYDLPVIRVRAFNHTGTRQSEDFVVPSFAMQIARIEARQQPAVIRVGNLAAQRDFTDVRDVVRAYHRLMESGTPGEVYQVASGKAHSIQSILDTLLEYATVTIDVRVDTERFRPVDSPIIQGDFSRLHQATGWQPEIPFEKTLRDILDDCRQRVNTSIRS
jgi:GDP-4-dehydro-6-deoxy-D-mannose reductase